MEINFLFEIVLVFICGSMIGSFLNVVIYRFPREKSIMYPPSKCPKCNREIPPYDNIPIFSWLFLKGKCRNCKEPISFRYPFVEFLTAALLVLTYLDFGITWQWFFLTYFICMLIVISWIDIDHLLILNSLTYPTIIIGLIFNFLKGNIFQSLLGAVIGGLFIYLLAKFSAILLKKEGMGMGDVTFVTVLGAWLGLNYLVGTLIISFFIGSIVGLVLMLLRGKSDYFPFGPSLALGALITLLTNNYLFEWYIKIIS